MMEGNLVAKNKKWKRKKRKRPNGCQTCYKAGNRGGKTNCWSKHTHAVVERIKADLSAKEQINGDHRRGGKSEA